MRVLSTCLTIKHVDAFVGCSNNLLHDNTDYLQEKCSETGLTDGVCFCEAIRLNG